MKTTATIEMKRMANENLWHIAGSGSVQNRIGAKLVQSRLATQLAVIVSILLGKKVSNVKALHLLNALTAGTCAVLFGGFSLMVQLLFLLWLGIAIWQFRK